MAQAQSVSTDEDTRLEITLAGSDVDGDSLSYEITAQPEHGVLSGTPGGALWSYDPAANYYGSDRIRFRVNDGQLDSAEAEVSIEVVSVNDVPVGVIEVRPLAVLRRNNFV